MWRKICRHVGNISVFVSFVYFHVKSYIYIYERFFLCLPCWSMCEIFSVWSLILTVYCQVSVCFITKILFFYIKHFDFLMWYSLIWIVLVFYLHNSVWPSSYKIIKSPLNRNIQTTSHYYFHVRCEGGYFVLLFYFMT